MAPPEPQTPCNLPQPAHPVFVALDLETTGLDAQKHEIIEIGAVRFEDTRVLAMTVQDCGLQLLVKPRQTIEPFISKLTGITNQMVQDQAPWSDVVHRVQAFLAPPASHFIAHNVRFEESFLAENEVSLQHLTLLDTYDMVHMFVPTASYAALEIVCHGLSLPLAQAHRAAHDALVTGQVFMRLWQRLQAMPDAALQQILAHASPDWPYRFLFIQTAAVRDLPPIHTNTPVTRAHGASHTPAATVPEDPAPASAESKSPAAVSVIRRALQPGTGTVLSLPGDSLHSQALARACVEWAAADHRHLLLCLPGFQEFSYQQRMLQGLQACARELSPAMRIAYQPHPQRLCDLTRLNTWKAGRTLDAYETRFLTKVLYWCSLASPDYRRLNSLFLFSHEPAAHDGHVRWPLVSGTAASDPADLEPGGNAFVPAASSVTGGAITVMDHDTFLVALDTNPDFARDFDGVILDDRWNLSHQIPVACTRYVTLSTLDYLQNRIRRLGPSGAADEIVTWLHQQPQGSVAIAALMTRLDALHPAWQRFTETWQAMAARQVESDSPRQDEISLDMAFLTYSQAWPGIRAAWQDYAHLARDAGHSLATLLATLPDMDADLLPDPARYIQQIRSLHHEFDTAIAHIDQLMQGGNEPDDPTRTWVRWLTLRPKKAHGEFKRTALWTETYVDQHVRAAFDAVLFLDRGRARTSPQDFLSVQLGLASCVHVRPPADLAKPELQIVMPDLLQTPGPRETADLVSHIAEQITGCMLVLFTGRTPLLQMAGHLEAALADSPIRVMVHKHDLCQDIASGLGRPGPKVLCGTYALLQDIALDNVEIQCAVITRIPFPPRSHPLRDRQSQRFVTAYDEFHAFVLPHVNNTLTRVIDQLVAPASPRGSLVLLDTRFRQSNMRGNRATGQKGLMDSWPRATRTHPPLARTASLVGEWLQQA